MLTFLSLFRALAVVAGCIVVGIIGSPAKAQTDRELAVAVRVVPPFVMKQEDRLAGFSIDLWQTLARSAGLRYRFVEKGPLAELLGSVENREADLAIAAISITSAREQRFDFSLPMFDAGLQIMVRADPGGGGLSFRAIAGLFTSGPIPALLGLLALLILIPAHVVWLVERNHPHSIVQKSYFPGIFSAIWWATGAAQGQQLDHPKSPLGRAISALAIFVSVIFIAYFTANVTSALTVQQLRSDIDGPEDLPGRRVVTVTGSTAAAFLRGQNVSFADRPTIREAVQVLLDRQADAVVFDSPVLLYFAANEGKGKVNVVGSVFRKEAYGILFPQGDPLRKRVNEHLLRMKEDGSYDAIYRRWFDREEKG